jgi:molybdenum cofactor biosynthesis protein B
MGVFGHRQESLENLRIGILTMSSTRSIDEDKSGVWIRSRAEKEGHQVVFHGLVKDSEEDIRTALRNAIRNHSPHAMILTGGTGITRADVTIEAVTPMFRKTLTAFSTIFTLLSYEEIDTAAILSRATAGIVADTVVFCLPGSLKACQTACKTIIFPELGHVVKHALEP